LAFAFRTRGQAGGECQIHSIGKGPAFCPPLAGLYYPRQEQTRSKTV